MTAEDRDVVVGRVIREKQEAKLNIAALRAELQRLGEDLRTVGDALIRNPELLIFQGEAHDSRFQPSALTRAETIDGKTILAKTNELRAVLLKEGDLERHLEAMGIK